jgi:hypothetical protein
MDCLMSHQNSAQLSTPGRMIRLKFNHKWTKCFRNQVERNSYSHGHMQAVLVQEERHKILTIIDIIVEYIYYESLPHARR